MSGAMPTRTHRTKVCPRTREARRWTTENPAVKTVVSKDTMKAVMCPSCRATTKRSGRTTAGRQRWRCRVRGASSTISCDDTATRLRKFLA